MLWEELFREAIDFCQRGYLSALTNFMLAVQEHSSLEIWFLFVVSPDFLSGQPPVS